MKQGKVLWRECTAHSKHPLPIIQETTLHMDITRWSLLKSDWLYSLQLKMETLYIVNTNKTRSWQLLRSWKTQIMNNSDHEQLIAKYRRKLKKVGKTTRPFRYDLNQIPYDYTVEVTNRFKGLDLIECLKNYGRKFVILYRRQWSNHPQEEEMPKGKMAVWGGLTNSWERKRSKRQVKRQDIPIWMQSTKE